MIRLWRKLQPPRRNADGTRRTILWWPTVGGPEAEPSARRVDLCRSTRSHERFGEEARRRHEELIATVIRDAASRIDNVGHTPRAELGDGVFSWRLARSRTRVRGETVRRQRHFLICRREGDVLVVGGVLHDAMELSRYVDRQQRWD